MTGTKVLPSVTKSETEGVMSGSVGAVTLAVQELLMTGATTLLAGLLATGALVLVMADVT